MKHLGLQNLTGMTRQMLLLWFHNGRCSIHGSRHVTWDWKATLVFPHTCLQVENWTGQFKKFRKIVGEIKKMGASCCNNIQEWVWRNAVQETSPGLVLKQGQSMGSARRKQKLWWKDGKRRILKRHIQEFIFCSIYIANSLTVLFLLCFIVLTIFHSYEHNVSGTDWRNLFKIIFQSSYILEMEVRSIFKEKHLIFISA